MTSTPGYPGSTQANLPYNLAYGRTVATNMWDGYLSSNYNSLQVAVNKSFSKGLLIKAAYTYSKTIDYTDDDGWASVGWNWAPVFQRNRAVAGFDRAHVLQIGWVYELPLGKGKTLVEIRRPGGHPGRLAGQRRDGRLHGDSVHGGRFDRSERARATRRPQIR